MAKIINPISYLAICTKAFSFLAACLFIIIAGCSQPNPVQPTEEEEYNAQNKFVQLQSCVDDEDYIRAKYFLNGYQKNFSHTHFYKMYSKKNNELAKKVEKNAESIKFDDRIEYLFVPPCLETKLWKEYMSRAESIVSQNRGGAGIAVLRIIFEDESLERPSVRGERNANNAPELYIFNGGGYSSMSSIQSGEAVFVGSGFWRYPAPDSNEKNVSASGSLVIGGLYHYPIKLKIEVQKGKAVAFGEIIVSSIPQKFRGNLKVMVKAEEDLNLMNANVSLALEGFMPGKTVPVKDNSCLFSSIGPAKYILTIVSDAFGAPLQSAVVVPGQTTEVTINAYRHRLIEFDWRFRNVNEPNNWLSGRKIMKTKEYWQPDDEWIDVHYPAFEFGDWTGNTCKIQRFNGELMHVDTNEPFEQMDFPSYFSTFTHDYPIKEGDIFAWRHKEPKGGLLEALIRIRKITPVGMSE